VRLVPLVEVALPKGLIGGPFGSSLGKKDYVSSGIPVIRGQNLAGPGRFSLDDLVFVTEAKAASELARNLAEPGDVIFTQRGTLGQVGVVPKQPYTKYVISQSQMRLRVDPDKADATYIYYCFLDAGMRDTIRSHAITTGVPHINLGILAELRVPLPPLPEQHAIAEVLGALDDKIEANGRTRCSGVALLQTLFSELTAPALAQIAEGVPLPPGWRLDRLESVLDVLETGSRPRGGVSGYSDGVPSLGAESVLGLALYDFSKTKHVPHEFFKEMRRGLVQDHDVLLYKDGGRPGEFEPHVSLLGEGFPFPQFCINEHVYRLRAAAPLSQEFLFFWLSSDPVLEEMRRRGTGVAIPGLNSTAVKDLPIALPSNGVIDKFTAIAEPVVLLALKSSRESRVLAQLRDALLPKLLSGELRVREAENLVEEAV
jgi:type I restriction enzyme S subunit